ncbi:hydrophobin-263 [Phlegmacium glaucopus]|nr:hydrophobin-263 [Phlegmacium glaucopus]
MFARAASVFVLALPLLATATILPRNPPSQCDSGSLQCCNSTAYATDPAVSTLLGLLGINVGSVTGLVGVTCSPITIGISGTSCNQQTVYCSNNSFNGVVAIGCTAININL